MNRDVESSEEAASADAPRSKPRWGFRQWLRVALGATMLFLAALSLYRFITGQGLGANREAQFSDPESMSFDSLPEFAKRLEAQGKFEDARQIYVMLCQQNPSDEELWSRCLALNEQEYQRNLEYREYQRNIQLSGEMLDLLALLKAQQTPTASEVTSQSVSIEEWTERRRQSAVSWIEGAVQLRQSAERAARLAARAENRGGSTDLNADALRAVAEEARVRLAPEVLAEVVSDLEAARRRNAWEIAADRWLLLQYLEPQHALVAGEESVGVETLGKALQLEVRRAPRARIREYQRALRALDPNHPALPSAATQ